MQSTSVLSQCILVLSIALIWAPVLIYPDRVNMFLNLEQLWEVMICLHMWHEVISAQKVIAHMHTKRESKHHDCATCYHSSQMAHYFLSLCLLLCFSFSLSLPRSIECRAFLFVCSYWALPADPVPDFPKADINITGHCNGVIFMEAPEEVTWLWLVPRGPGVSIKPVVLTHITINEVEKLRK